MSNGFRPPQKSYGGGLGRHMVYQVVNRKDDPEQSGRLRVRAVGYEDDIPEDKLNWARPMGGMADASDGGIGGFRTGATENTYMVGFLVDGSQQPMLLGSIGKAGENQNGEGQADPSGRKHDLNRHSRDEDKGGGDFRYASDKQDYGDKGITQYAKDEAKNPHGRSQSKDADENPEKSYSIGQDLYA